MARGQDHDKVNSVVMLGVIVTGLITKSDSTIITGLGIGLGTLWLSPDLDLRKSNPSNRLGLFKELLGPYRALCGHHRSFLSHSPIVSSLVRVLYFLSPFIVYCLLTENQVLLNKVTLSSEFFYTLVGLEIATDLHLFLDWQSSFFKKIRKV